MTLEQFRKMALSLEGAEEREHMGHPDFRVNGKIFATLQPAKGVGMVRLTPDQQHTYLALDPTSFTPVPGAWGAKGATLVPLKAADSQVVREALEQAWRGVRAAQKTQPRKKVPRSSS